MLGSKENPAIDESDFVLYSKIGLSRLQPGAIVRTENDEGGCITFEVVEPMGEARKQPKVRILECSVGTGYVDVIGMVMNVAQRFAVGEATPMHAKGNEITGFVPINTGIVKSLKGIDVPEDLNEEMAVELLCERFGKATIATMNRGESFEERAYTFALDLALAIADHRVLDMSAGDLNQVAKVFNEYFFSHYSDPGGSIRTFTGCTTAKSGDGKFVHYKLKASFSLEKKCVISFDLRRDDPFFRY